MKTFRASEQRLRATDEQRRGQIHRALLEKADAERQSMTPGRRERALALVREAMTHGTSVQARSVAASALAVTDVRVTQTWPVGRMKTERSPMRFTPDLSHHLAIVPTAMVRDKAWKQGALGLWRTADHALLKQIPLTDKAGLFDMPALSPDVRWALCAMAASRRWKSGIFSRRGRRWMLRSAVQPIGTFHPTDGTLIACANRELVRIRPAGDAPRDHRHWLHRSRCHFHQP